jgi:hypothetical protein
MRGFERRWERDRARELADVELACASEGADRLSDHDEPSQSSGSGSSPETVPPRKRQRTARSQAKDSPEVVPLVPDKSPAHRFRRKADEIYQEREKSDGTYRVII